MKMMFSKPYNKDKVKFPCYVSRKYDGVPVIFWVEDGVLHHATRQGNQVTSIDHIIANIQDMVDKYKLEDGFICCGEVYKKDTPFKDISGDIRRGRPALGLVFIMFEEPKGYANLTSIHDYEFLFLPEEWTCNYQEDVDKLLTEFSDDWEGMMIRHGEYEHGKRSWNSMKFKREPTLDLEVVEVIQSKDKHGNLKDMIGSFDCKYKDGVVRVGAGKLSHAERKEVWSNPEKYVGKIIEVKHMKDDSYDALRQPTFQRWRFDKDEVNWEEA